MIAQRAVGRRPQPPVLHTGPRRLPASPVSNPASPLTLGMAAGKAGKAQQAQQEAHPSVRSAPSGYLAGTWAR